MKKLLLATAALSVSLAGSAFAQSAQVDLFGDIPVVCSVTNNAPESALDLTSTATQSTGSLTYKCNALGGLQRTITSANNGVLARTGGGATLAYKVTHGGGSGLGIAAPGTQPSTPIITGLGGSAAFAAGQTGSLSVTLDAPGVFAGTYTDTLTVTLAAL